MSCWGLNEMIQHTKCGARYVWCPVPLKISVEWLRDARERGWEKKKVEQQEEEKHGRKTNKRWSCRDCKWRVYSSLLFAIFKAAFPSQAREGYKNKREEIEGEKGGKKGTDLIGIKGKQRWKEKYWNKSRKESKWRRLSLINTSY